MNKLRFQRGFDGFVKHLQSGDKVLDFNYSSGLYAKLFFEKGLEVIAFDKNPLGHDKSPYAEILNKDPMEAVLPFRSFNGVWITDSLTGLSKDTLPLVISQCVDWLTVTGSLYLCMLEGDGEKVVQQQLPTGIKTKRIVYYQPEEIDQILNYFDCPAVEAWYENNLDRRWIHILAQRKR